MGFCAGVLPKGVQFVYEVTVKPSREMLEVTNIFIEVVDEVAELPKSVVVREVVQINLLLFVTSLGGCR